MLLRSSFDTDRSREFFRFLFFRYIFGFVLFDDGDGKSFTLILTQLNFHRRMTRTSADGIDTIDVEGDLTAEAMMFGFAGSEEMAGKLLRFALVEPLAAIFDLIIGALMLHFGVSVHGPS